VFSTAVVIVGAGPYGLSLASHLSARRVPFRIFGAPMQVWREHMPQGMHLKSDGFASDLYDPERRFTLRNYCAVNAIPYRDYGLPMRIETFIEYGLAFQKTMVPTLTDQHIVRITAASNGFVVHTRDGEVLTAPSVVLATGITYCSVIPEPLSSLPPQLCSHSFGLHDLARFKGRRVLVVGGGASATDVASKLAAQGTSVELISRHAIEFHRPPNPLPPSPWKRLTAPNLGLGPNFRSAVYTAFPGVVRCLPQRVRLRIVRRHLGPAGGWFVRDELVGKVPMHECYSMTTATPDGDEVRLRCEDTAGRSFEWHADHVIAATGYRVSIDRVQMLDPALRLNIRRAAGSPVLSGRFESSVPGLYFIGVAAASSFGPVMRFARGAEYCATHLGRGLASLSRRRMSGRSKAQVH
jgi:cation diffusion facilitator CzcD-associated flavoprotein CzcO